MTKLMLLVKPRLLRPQFSFDDCFADVAVVDDGDVTEMLISPASLSLTTQLGLHAATELVSHVMMAPLVNHGVTELANHGTRPRNLVKVKSAHVVVDVMTIQRANLVTM